eukprot:357951-Chlamydomonas_euryale.AAC.4
MESGDVASSQRHPSHWHEFATWIAPVSKRDVSSKAVQVLEDTANTDLVPWVPVVLLQRRGA